MESLYFLVTGSPSWDIEFHNNFFITKDAFLWGFVLAAVLGLVFCLAFYFGCCNSKKSAKSANIGVWAVFMLITGLCTYFVSDMVIIGGSQQPGSVFYEYSFYKSNEDHYLKLSQNPNASDSLLQEWAITKQNIRQDLNKGGDVRFDYDITNTVYALLFFFLWSLLFKRFTHNGKSIPLQNP